MTTLARSMATGVAYTIGGALLIVLGIVAVYLVELPFVWVVFNLPGSLTAVAIVTAVLAVLGAVLWWLATHGPPAPPPRERYSFSPWDPGWSEVQFRHDPVAYYRASDACGRAYCAVIARFVQRRGPETRLPARLLVDLAISLERRYQPYLQAHASLDASMAPVERLVAGTLLKFDFADADEIDRMPVRMWRISDGPYAGRSLRTWSSGASSMLLEGLIVAADDPIHEDPARIEQLMEALRLTATQVTPFGAAVSIH